MFNYELFFQQVKDKKIALSNWEKDVYIIPYGRKNNLLLAKYMYKERYLWNGYYEIYSGFQPGNLNNGHWKLYEKVIDNCNHLNLRESIMPISGERFYYCPNCKQEVKR